MRKLCLERHGIMWPKWEVVGSTRYSSPKPSITTKSNQYHGASARKPEDSRYKEGMGDATKDLFSFALHRCLSPHLGGQLSGIYVNPLSVLDPDRMRAGYLGR